jgi:hypothetical protein
MECIDEEIIFKVSEWHHITWTVSDHQMVKLIAAAGRILVCLLLYHPYSKHMKMLCISGQIASRVMTLQWYNNHRRIYYMLEVAMG